MDVFALGIKQQIMNCPTHFIVLFSNLDKSRACFEYKHACVKEKLVHSKILIRPRIFFSVELSIFQILYKNLPLYQWSNFWTFSEQCKKLQQDKKKKLFLKTSSLSNCGVWCIYFFALQKNSQNLDFPPQCKQSCPSLWPTIVFYPSQLTIFQPKVGSRYILSFQSKVGK